MSGHSKNKTPFLGNATPVLGVKPKRVVRILVIFQKQNPVLGNAIAVLDVK